MSLTKLVIVGAVAVVFLPTDKTEQAKLLAQAGGAATWALTYCERNPETCETAGQNWEVFKEKAAFGSELAQDALWQVVAASPTPFQGENTNPGDTLTNTDRSYNWRGRN